MKDDVFLNFKKEIKKIFERQSKEETIQRNLDFCAKCLVNLFFYNQEISSWHGQNQYWILWIDILGFKETILNNSPKYIIQLLSHIGTYNNIDPIGNFIFSDTLLQIYKFGKTDLISLLENTIWLQISTIALFEQLLRGSIILDEVFYMLDNKIDFKHSISNLFIFGKGIIRAYNLEQTIKYPIITIDPTIIELIFFFAKKFPKYYPEELPETIQMNNKKISSSFIKKIFCEGESTLKYILNKLLKPMLNKLTIHGKDYYYLDYINYIINTQSLEVIKSFLETHKFIIVSNLTKYKTVPKIFEKYKWLKDYHNLYIKKYALDKSLLIGN